MDIIVTGKAGSGKSTLTGALQKYWGARGIAVFCCNLAEPIYRMADAVYVVGRHFGIEPPAGGKDRELLQALGDEWGNKKDPEIWVKAAKNKIAQVTKLWEEKGLLYIVLLERVCHPNQLAAWPDAFKIQLHAPESVRKERCAHWPLNPNHASETALDGAVFDAKYDTSVLSTEDIVKNVAEAVKERFDGGRK
jgi:dephospho-CoA kinase